MKKLLRFVFVLLGIGGSAPAVAQVPDPAFANNSLYAPGTVFDAVPQADGKRVVCGTLTRVNGTAVGSLVRFDAAGALDQSFTQNVGKTLGIRKILALANGQYLLLANGDTLTAGGKTSHDFLRLNADGTADASFDVGTGITQQGARGEVFDVQPQPDGKLLVVGVFDAFNGVAAHDVVRLHSNGTLDASFNAGAGADHLIATVLTQPDGKIIVGGYFSTFAGHDSKGIARLNADGSYDASFTSPFYSPGVVDMALQPDGKLLVAGRMERVLSPTNQVVYPGVARLNADGSLDTSFSAPSMQGIALGSYDFKNTILRQPDGKILVRGYPDTWNRVLDNGIVRLNADGSIDAGFQVNASPSYALLTMALQANGTILVGGAPQPFGSLGDLPLFQLTSTGAPDLTFAPVIQRPGSLNKVVPQPDGKLLIAGYFTELAGQRVRNLVRLSATGALDAAFSTNVGQALESVSGCLLQPDGKILVNNRTSIRRLNADGTPDSNFKTVAVSGASGLSYGTILALQPDGKIVVSGSFVNLNNTYIPARLARLDANGNLDASFVTPAPPVIGYIRQAHALLLQADGKIVVSAQYGGRKYVSRYLTTGGLDTGFLLTASPANTVDAVYALAQQPDGKLLIGGNFRAYGTSSQAMVARLTETGTLDPTFAQSTISTDGVVFELVVQPNNRILVAGSFQSTASPVQTNIMRLLADGQSDSSFGATANTNGVTRSVAVSGDGKIMLGGSFTRVGGQDWVAVTRLTAPGVLHVASVQLEARTQAWPVPAHEALTVSFDASAQPQSVQLLDNLGRMVLTQQATQATLILPLKQVKAGVYLLRVNYAAGPVTRRVVVE